MNPLKNPFTKNQVGHPAGLHGKLGLFLPTRKLISALYVPDRWARLGLRGWSPYLLAIPDSSPTWTVDGQATIEVTASTPVKFAAVGVGVHSLAAVVIELYDAGSQQSIINSSGPNLLLDNLGGTAKFPFFFKKPYTMDAGNTLILTVTNLSLTQNQGQVVLWGYEPLFPGITQAPASDEPVWPGALS